MKKSGFTLAEVLITLAIIGVVAALTIPSVVANTQQQEFKTGLKKAVSVLNSAITMNIAIDGETPYDNGSLYHYLGRHMSVMKTRTSSPAAAGSNGWSNAAFYTTDGMRFEFPSSLSGNLDNVKLITESGEKLLFRVASYGYNVDSNGRLYSGAIDTPAPFSSATESHCGSYGLKNNPDNTIHTPCYMVVDVNGDRKPFPQNASCYALGGNWTCTAADIAKNVRKYSDVNGKKLTDTFPIIITDRQAIPFGVAAQKAMYEAQK